MIGNNIRGRHGPRSPMVFRLWCMMMVLVLFTVGAVWVVQITLFERNYINSAIEGLQNRLEPIMEELEQEDLAHSPGLIPYLSKSTNGKMILLDKDAEAVSIYSYGYPLDLETWEGLVWHNIKGSAEYTQLKTGEKYKKVNRNEGRAQSVEMGIPITYDGQRAYVILYHSLDELYTVLDINRGQLVTLTVLLTLAASVIAALFSRQFTRPIGKIRDTVNSLARGDLEAVPGLARGDELGELSRSVEELGQALHRVDVLRKEVIANVSHELRSPLALIVGYGELVRDVSWTNQAAREEHLGLIIHEARRMSEMVSDIMDYSQFQAGYVRLRLDRYNLYDIVEAETARCEAGAGEHGITIRLVSFGTEATVMVDALKISQVVRNLLYNAINHTADGETILVEVAELEGGFQVSVSNPGEPLTEEEQALIWERYQRSQHQGGRSEGTGLGLSIVSAILAAHGIPYGVDCHDSLTVFWFRCPRVVG